MNEPAAISNQAPEDLRSSDPEPAKRSRFGPARMAKAVLLAMIVAVLIYYYQRGDLTQENLKRIATALPTSLFLPAFLLLPMCGFPINIFLLAGGMKYGLLLAVAISAVAMGIQTFAAWHLANGLFRERLENWLSDTRFELPKIPEHHQIWFTSVFVAIPGLPYAVKLYSLALTNLSFRRYLTIVWLVHAVGAIPLIGIGVAAINVNVVWLIGFGILGLLTILATNWLKNWYTRRLAEEEHAGSE